MMSDKPRLERAPHFLWSWTTWKWKSGDWPPAENRQPDEPPLFRYWIRGPLEIRRFYDLGDVEELSYRKDGGFSTYRIILNHPWMHALAGGLIEVFEKFGGSNYLELAFFHEDTGEEYSLHIQRKSGLTPAQKAVKLEEDNRRAAEAYDALLAENQELRIELGICNRQIKDLMVAYQVLEEWYNEEADEG